MAATIRVNPAQREKLARVLPSIYSRQTGWVVDPVNAASRRRRWPKASVYRGLPPSHNSTIEYWWLLHEGRSARCQWESGINCAPDLRILTAANRQRNELVFAARHLREAPRFPIGRCLLDPRAGGRDEVPEGETGPSITAPPSSRSRAPSSPAFSAIRSPARNSNIRPASKRVPATSACPCRDDDGVVIHEVIRFGVGSGLLELESGCCAQPPQARARRPA